MVAWHTEQNAETRGRRGAKLIDENLIENKISASIIDAAIEVHRVLGGPGLLESIYKGVPIRDALRLDLLVDDRVIVEIKATESLLKVHSAQVLTYLRLTQRKLGLVLNFGQTLLRNGVSRVVNGL